MIASRSSGEKARTDNTVVALVRIRGVLVGEFVPDVPIGGLRGIENEVSRFPVVVLPGGDDLMDLDADLVRIEGGIAEQECFRAVCRGAEQVVQRRHRAVMQERRGGPYAVQRTGLVAEAGSKTVRPVAFDRQARVLPIWWSGTIR